MTSTTTTAGFSATASSSKSQDIPPWYRNQLHKGMYIFMSSKGSYLHGHWRAVQIFVEQEISTKEQYSDNFDFYFYCLTIIV